MIISCRFTDNSDDLLNFKYFLLSCPMLCLLRRYWLTTGFLSQLIKVDYLGPEIVL